MVISQKRKKLSNIIQILNQVVEHLTVKEWNPIHSFIFITKQK